MRRLIFLLILTFSLLPKSLRAQLAFSDSVRVSLLTVSAGPEVYERFGHTGLRLQDLKTGQDIVFHYGVFNFNAPHFIYRFLKGETDYRIGALYYRQFEDDYRQRGLRMTQQTLNLSQKESRRVVELLLENYRPENRIYRYSFFFDNCATRPYTLIEKATDRAILYDTTLTKAVTLRDMLHEKTGRDTWLNFGIALVIAGRADRPTTFAERMFLPEYLMNAYAQASLTDSLRVGQRPLVGETTLLLELQPDIARQIADPPFYLAPNFCCWLLLVIVLLAGWLGARSGHRLRWLDTILLCCGGVAAVLIWFMCFLSVHPAVENNLNCLWLWPTHLLFMILIWIKKWKKLVNIYFFLNFAAIIAYIIIGGFVQQYVNPAFIPLALTFAIRSFVLSDATTYYKIMRQSKK